MTCQIRIKEWLRLEDISEVQTEDNGFTLGESHFRLHAEAENARKKPEASTGTFICKAECSSEQFAAASSDSLPQPKQGVES